MKGKQGADGTAVGDVWVVRQVSANAGERWYYQGKGHPLGSAKQRDAKRFTLEEANECIDEMMDHLEFDEIWPTAPRPVRLVPRRPLSALTVAIASLGLSPAVTKALSGIAAELTAAHRDALEALAARMGAQATECAGHGNWSDYGAWTEAARMVREAASAGATR